MLQAIRSLGYRTDLRILAFDGLIAQREAYWVAKCPDNPGYFWGNLLVFRHPPGPGDLEAWSACFREEFGSDPRIGHMTFGWDSPDGATAHLEPFLSDGFELSTSVVLSTRQVVPPPRPNPELTIRPIRTDADWEAAILNQVATREEGFDEAKYTVFKRAQMATYRRMAEAGHGSWYGAFLGDTLVGDLGLYHFEELGRFQSVGTHPDHRGRGVCGTLVYEVARGALASGQARELVMVADENYHAARIYESVGFRPTEKMAGLCKRNRALWS